MRQVLLSVVVAGLFASSGNAVILSLAADDGTGRLDLLPRETGNVNIIVEIQDINVLGFGFANVFLDDENNQGDGQLAVVELIQGFDEPADDLTYFRDLFTLPADISHDLNNEYGLIMGRTDEGGWGPGIYTVDTMVIINGSDELGEHPITFEKGARAPQIWKRGFASFPWGLGLAGIIPHFADPGVGGADNPFMINTIPEPASLTLVAFGGLVLLGRRR